MTRDEILQKLTSNAADISKRFGVISLSVFGSVSRGEEHENSDVDLLVEFAGPATFDGYFDLKFYLEDLLGRSVDLVTTKALRKELRPHVERDLIRVA